MNQSSIKKISLLAILILLIQKTQGTLDNDLIKNDNEKIVYENLIKDITPSEPNKLQIPRAMLIALACASAYQFAKGKDILYSEDYQYESKKNNIIEKIETKITDGDFGNYFKNIYNEIIFEPSISSILNNSKLTTSCQDLLKNCLIEVQAENKLFLETFVLLLGLNKTIYTLKKGLRNALNIGLSTVLPILACSFAHYKSSECVKESIKNKVSKINYIESRPLLKETAAISGNLIVDTLVLTPVFGKLCLYIIEGIQIGISDSYKCIKKGKGVRLIKELYNFDESADFKKSKSVYEGGKTALKTYASIEKIIKAITKLW